MQFVTQLTELQVMSVAWLAHAVILRRERALFAREPRRMAAADAPQSRDWHSLGRSSFEARMQPQRAEDARERAYGGCMLAPQDDDLKLAPAARAIRNRSDRAEKGCVS
jgi:hypothetical protein